MPLSERLEWAEPLAYLSGLSNSGMDYALLYSGMRTAFSGRYSLLAIQPKNIIQDNDFRSLSTILTQDRTQWENSWIGYLGYGLKNALEQLTEDKPSFIDLPKLRMMQYETVLVFDHDKKTLTAYRSNENSPLTFPYLPSEETKSLKILEFASDLSKQEYIAQVNKALEEIARGSLYQANLTRKFYGKLENAPDSAKLFSALCTISPAPYSALLKWGDTAIISSSPEQFLRLDADGSVETRPIKGSARRSGHIREDEAIKEALLHSEKNRAENLMIVDLMRNDLAKSCETGSVKVQSLFDLHSYATVHHLSSTVSGIRRIDISPIELVAGCFPPGSMTGAPKIRAMELCSQLEPRARGVYSGALGWFGGDGSAELSVVIRTIVLQGNRFEFQVGGGIVQDSTAEDEWEETLIKASAIAKVLGISVEQLKEL